MWMKSWTIHYSPKQIQNRSWLPCWLFFLAHNLYINSVIAGFDAASFWDPLFDELHTVHLNQLTTISCLLFLESGFISCHTFLAETIGFHIW